MRRMRYSVWRGIAKEAQERLASAKDKMSSWASMSESIVSRISGGRRRREEGSIAVFGARLRDVACDRNTFVDVCSKRHAL